MTNKTQDPKSSQEFQAELKRLTKDFDELYQIKINNTRRITRNEFDDLKKRVTKLEKRVQESK